MATRLPKDLEENGGWNFTEPFLAATLEEGQIWRKCGPVDAIKIRSVQLPDREDYDGGLLGISVYFSIFPSNAKKVRWAEDSSFIAGNHDRLMRYMKDNGYTLAYQPIPFGSATYF
jgi:hypothetical protein